MWTKLQNLPWYLRWPAKWALVALALFLVSFPNPLLFVRHVQHWQNPNAMIQADHPQLQPWVTELNEQLEPGTPPPEVLKTVQKFVYHKVPYRFDWETWGSADYLPTLAEVLEVGAEDCDGRAVVAASLLRNLGFKADLVTDFTHVWVKTDKGETMSPGRRKSVIATRKGFLIDWRAVTRTLPRSLAYGISPFPLGRELVVLAVLWIVLLRPGVGWPAKLICLLIMVDGLLVLRGGGANWRRPDAAVQLWGLGQIIGPIAALLILGRRPGRADPATATEQQADPAS